MEVNDKKTNGPQTMHAGGELRNPGILGIKSPSSRIIQKFPTICIMRTTIKYRLMIRINIISKYIDIDVIYADFSRKVSHIFHAERPQNDNLSCMDSHFE